VGERDSVNPNAIPADTLLKWQKEGDIEWWGYRNDMPRVFSESHIVCLPSYREGLPKVLLEAAACARPIVTTDAPGCREIVRDGYNGILVPIKNVQALAEGLKILIHNKKLRKEMGSNGHELVLSEFSIEKVIQDTLALYQGMIIP